MGGDHSTIEKILWKWTYFSAARRLGRNMLERSRTLNRAGRGNHGGWEAAKGQGGAAGVARVQADAVLLKALSHPVRARALTALNQRVASPSELAEEQGEAVGYVAYHVRVLHELGMIEQVEDPPGAGRDAAFLPQHSPPRPPPQQRQPQPRRGGLARGHGPAQFLPRGPDADRERERGPRGRADSPRHLRPEGLRVPGGASSA